MSYNPDNTYGGQIPDDLPVVDGPDMTPCPNCGGSGMNMWSEDTCPTCGGSGMDPNGIH